MRQKLKPITAIAFYVTLSVLISSCGHRIHEGKIIEKRHEQARTYTYVTFVPMNKTTIPITHVGYDDEDFVIIVRGVSDGDTITEEFYVDESNWKCMGIGNIFNDSVPCTREDDGTR